MNESLGVSHGFHVAVAALMISLKYDSHLLDKTLLALDFTLSGLVYSPYSLKELLLIFEQGSFRYIILPKSMEIQWKALCLELYDGVEVVFCTTVDDVLHFYLAIQYARINRLVSILRAITMAK